MTIFLIAIVTLVIQGDDDSDSQSSISGQKIYLKGKKGSINVIPDRAKRFEVSAVANVIQSSCFAIVFMPY